MPSVESARRLLTPAVAAVVCLLSASIAHADPVWAGYAGNAQHTALSAIPSQSLQGIIWSTPVDLNPPVGTIFIHYGSPLVTAANSVIVPVKTGAMDGFQVEVRNGANGVLKYTLPTDYVSPAHDWLPSYSPTLTPTNRLYYPGAGGTVYYRDTPDAVSGATGQIAFFGNSAYAANASAFNENVKISTPITSDQAGNIYFGYRVSGALPAGSTFTSGIARIAPDGTATYVNASSLVSDSQIQALTMDCAPAISADGKTVYVTVNGAGGYQAQPGYLVALNSTTLQTKQSVALKDIKTGMSSILPDTGTASPTIGPDGDVYIGVFDNPPLSNHDRGWMLHFSADLSQQKPSGAFGWDNTPSIVPATMVPSYHGASNYLLMTKYNNYASTGGNGDNRLAILDPNATMIDPITGATVMKEVLTISGVTPDGPPPAVTEWCINTAVVDPATDSILVNNEDGRLYRWDLSTNTLSQAITLTSGIGEAYTPTLIGADGKVYAINAGVLFAVGVVPEPSTLGLGIGVAVLLLGRRRARR